MYASLLEKERLGLVQLGSMKEVEFVRLAAHWHPGTFPSLELSFIYHADKHFDRDLARMLRSARHFSLRGAVEDREFQPITPGARRFTKGGRYMVISADARIISYGRQ